MANRRLTTPIAFLIFNRPDTTARVFAAIRQARPPKLLVVADGPRPDREGEVQRCEAVRKIVSGVDWPCEILTNFSDVNLGCKRRVSSGLDWIFNTVEEAIILEDDCVPHSAFFRYCDELLEQYRNDERIMMISGTNLIGASAGKESYFFSKYPHIWGWASWRRAWKHYDVNMTMWPRLRDAASLDLGTTSSEKRFWISCFDRVYDGKVDTWDAQVTFMSFCQHGLTIFPKNNLISNIGFGADATHTKGWNALAGLDTAGIEFPLDHPHILVPNLLADRKRQRLEYSSRNLAARVAGKIIRYFGLKQRGLLP